MLDLAANKNHLINSEKNITNFEIAQMCNSR